MQFTLWTRYWHQSWWMNVVFHQAKNSFQERFLTSKTQETLTWKGALAIRPPENTCSRDFALKKHLKTHRDTGGMMCTTLLQILLWLTSMIRWGEQGGGHVDVQWCSSENRETASWHRFKWGKLALWGFLALPSRLNKFKTVPDAWIPQKRHPENQS